MSINRKDFIKGSLASVATLAVGSSFASSCMPSPAPKKGGDNGLNLAFQEWVCYGDTLEEKLDFMESLGVVGLELGGKGLAARVPEIERALKGRNIKVSAICAGFDEFILCEDKARRDKCISSSKEIMAAAGELGSVGMIMVPAFNGHKPCYPHTQATRDFLIEQLTELGEYGVQHGTTLILEPLNRKEAFYLRQVADAASMCRDSKSDGLRCMGDYWHMTAEETSDMGAFLSGGDLMNHVHIASRATRSIPGQDGEVDNYVDGFKALKMLGYTGHVSFECGCKGDDRKGALTAAVDLLNKQWKQAKI